jgi:hypothetical protein
MCLSKVETKIKVIAGVMIAFLISPWLIAFIYPPATAYTFLPLLVMSCCIAALPIYYQSKYSMPMFINKGTLIKVKDNPERLQKYMQIERLTSILALGVFALAFLLRNLYVQ